MRLRQAAGVIGLAFGLSAAVAAQTSTSSVTTAEGGSTAALDTQTTQMDGLATSRGDAKVTGKIADTFAGFAGSRANAVSLASGLRNGSEITLAGATNGSGGGASDAVTFMPPTKPMGHGNAFNSLALAQQQLASQGITEPTPQQIEAALNGGTITVGEGADAKTVELRGVLQMRADGMGWGQIAHAQGTKLGPVISGLKSANASIAKQPKTVTATSASGTTAGTGVTNAAGGASSASTGNAKHAGNAKRQGVVNAAGGGYAGAGSAHSSRGIQNATGGSAGSGQGHAYGRTKSEGIVTATGSSAGNASAGSGIVTASGGGHGAAAAAATSHGRGAGVVSAGGGQGHGNAYGHGKK